MENNSNSLKQFENNFLKLSHIDGILHMEFKPKVKFNLEEIEETISLRHQFSNHQHQYVCLSLKNVRSFSKEIWEYTHLYGQEYIHACAFVIHSHIAKFIYNVFVTYKKPKIPIKAFSKKEDAVAWLLALKAKNERKEL